MKLRLPFYKQDKSYTCGPAALQGVLDFLGTFKSEGWLTSHLHTDKEKGTSHEEMIRLAERLGFQTHTHPRGSLREIKYFLKQELPIIVNYIEPEDEEGHYAVVSGLENGNIILNDPWLGRDFKLQTQDFKKRWHNSAGNSQAWLLVVSSQPIKCRPGFLGYFKNKTLKA